MPLPDKGRPPGGARVDLGATPVTVQGAQAVLRRPDGRVLLQLRIWPPGWELPGGHCGAGEDPAGCAVREAAEETGLVGRDPRLGGVYRWSGLRHTADAVYLIDVDSTRPRRSLEAVAYRWVDRGRYPRTVFPWVPRRIEDALDVAAGADPVLRLQPVTPRHVLFFGSTWAATVVDAGRRLSRWPRRLRRPR